MGLLLALAASAGAATTDEQRLAERFAPLLEVKEQQDPPCDTSGEQYIPSAVEIVLGRRNIVLRGPGDDAGSPAPTAADLFGKGAEWSLDYPGSPFDPGCTYARDAIALGQGDPAVAYAHIVTQPDAPRQLALQYWFFYYFNQFNDLHEGDWEMIQLVFDASTAAEALDQEPVWVGYSQHDGGERAGWDDDKLEREGTHPVVYPAAGSHANYFSSELWLGRSASEGFGCDDTTGPSQRIVPEVRVVGEPSGPDAADAWLAFEGNWGQKARGLFNAPTGPNTNKKWSAPIDWEGKLRNSSIAVPAGDAIGVTVTGFFCSAVAEGSRLYADMLDSPLTASLTLLIIGVTIAGATRLTRWSPVERRRVLAPRAIGQVLRAARAIHWRNIVRLTAVGLVFVPLAALGTAAQAGLLWIPTVAEFGGGGVRVVLPLGALIGFVVTLIAYVAMLAAVAEAVRRDEAGSPVGPLGAYRALLPRWKTLLGATARATGIVLLLVVSIVGFPWAIRQAVRWAFIPQVVVFEGPPAPAARCLGRSSDLVRGRWWRTAVLLVLLGVIALAPGVVLGLALLLFTTFSLPLVNFIGALVTVFVLPYVAVALTLAYGDRVTRGPAGRRRRRWTRLWRREGEHPAPS